MSGGGFYPLTVVASHADGAQGRRIALAVPPHLQAEFAYEPGQHVTLRMPSPPGDKEGEQRRAYSLCRSPRAGELQLAVKRIPGGRVSRWLNDELRVGQQLAVMPPAGRFLPQAKAQAAQHTLAFAAGSGITPLFSILEHGLLTTPDRRYTLVYSNRDPASMMLGAELSALKDLYPQRLNVLYFFSQSSEVPAAYQGRLTPDFCEALLRTRLRAPAIDLALVCGPPGMMQAVQAALLAHGLAADDIRLEYYGLSEAQAPSALTPDRSPSAPAETLFRVQMRVEGWAHELEFRPSRHRSLLQAALEVGIPLRYSCQSGVCATCRCKVKAGKVEMHGNFALDEQDLAQGWVLSCRSLPTTAHTELIFE